jgi:hypothetical protein
MCDRIAYNSGIATLRVGGTWLNSGKLLVCLAKPPARTAEILTDASLPAAVEFARALFERTANAPSKLQTWFDGQAGVVAFPEFIFSSHDFAELDCLVSSSESPLIVLAGFGSTLGSRINELLQQGCLSSWGDGERGIDPQGNYNAGWCWVHLGAGNTTCTIFLKNFPDQRAELFAIPNSRFKRSILRVETEDLILFPLICADLINEEADSPRRRISASLSSGSGGRKALVCTLCYNQAPQSEWWRGAIDDVVQQQNHTTILVLVNQCVTQPQVDEQDDRWRCLTGAFIRRTRMQKPARCFSDVRYVQTETMSSGLLLRSPFEGVAVGLIRWDLSGSATGRYVWEPITRTEGTSSGFLPVTMPADECEIRRYFSRRTSNILACYPSVRTQLSSTLAAISSANKDELTPRLWPDLLDGPRSVLGPRSADPLTDRIDDLDWAFADFAVVQYSTGGNPLCGGPKRGQLLWNDKEVRVWRSPDLREDQMCQSLESIALAGGELIPLFIVGRGNGVGANVASMKIAAKKVQSGPLTDISSPSPESDLANNIESTRERPVYWRPLSDIEGLLLTSTSNPPPDLPQVVRELITAEFPDN